VTAQLPVQNKYTLRHLFGFLKEITSHSEHNKMGSHNLAIVFGPNLLNRRGASTQDHGAEVHQQQKVVQEMIDSYDHIFSGIEEEENLFVEQMRLMCEEKQDLLKHGAMAIHNLEVSPRHDSMNMTTSRDRTTSTTPKKKKKKKKKIRQSRQVSQPFGSSSNTTQLT